MNSGESFVSHVGCVGCGSSDAVGVYDDGHGYCFSCGAVYPAGTFSDNGDTITHLTPINKKHLGLLEKVTIKGLSVRGITKETCEAFGYGMGKFNGEIVHVAPYCDAQGRVIAQKIRTKDKDFIALGDIKNAVLFGQPQARGGGKMLTITEGEIDALSVWQAMGGRWPVVSIKSGAGVGNGAKKVSKELAKELDFLLSFDKVVFAFDMDEPGRQSAEAAASILPAGKAYVCQLPPGYKDANEMVVAGESRALVNAVFGAKQWRPDGIVSLLDEEVLNRITTLPEMGITYPWSGLNQKTFGLHPGQIHVIGAGSGTGKSVVCAELCVHLRKQGLKVGYIALEESVGMTGQRLAGILLNKPLYIPGEHNVSKEDIETALRSLVGDDKDSVVLYDHFGSLDTDVLFSRLRYMSAHLGINVIIIDHLSIIISGNEEENERKMIDLVMTKLRSFTEETGVIIVLVTHLTRRQGQSFECGAEVTLATFRGSGSIGQLCDVALGLERDQQAEDQDDRDTLNIRVVKCRLGGRTGLACTLKYHHDTGRLTDYSQELLNEDRVTRPQETQHEDY